MAEKLDEKTTWLANQIFEAFPQEVSGLKFYALASVAVGVNPIDCTKC